MDKTATERKRRQRENKSQDGLFKPYEIYAHPSDLAELKEMECKLQQKWLSKPEETKMTDLNLDYKFAHLSGHTVYVLYKLNLVEFFVKWCNINCDGDIDSFDLESDVICSNETYKERIEKSIQEGERDDNDDIEIYLFIRDKFSSIDCQQLFDNYVEDSQDDLESS